MWHLKTCLQKNEENLGWKTLLNILSEINDRRDGGTAKTKFMEIFQKTFRILTDSVPFETSPFDVVQLTKKRKGELSTVLEDN